MESISQRQMRNESGAILRRVQAGESFVITNNGVEVAKLVPYGGSSHPDRDDLIARGVLVNRKIRRRGLPTPVVVGGVDVDAIFDDLRGDR